MSLKLNSNGARRSRPELNHIEAGKRKSGFFFAMSLM